MLMAIKVNRNCTEGNLKATVAAPKGGLIALTRWVVKLALQ